MSLFLLGFCRRACLLLCLFPIVEYGASGEKTYICMWAGQLAGGVKWGLDIIEGG
jgi:hypothetical protein